MGKKAGWMSRVGNDELGEYVVSTIRGEGVDTSAVKAGPPRADGVVLERTAHARSTPRVLLPPGFGGQSPHAGRLDEAYMRQANVLHSDRHYPLLERIVPGSGGVRSCHRPPSSAHRVIRPEHSPEIVDSRRGGPVLRRFISQSDIVLPGLEEGKWLYSEKDPERLAEKILEPPPCVRSGTGSPGGVLCDEGRGERVCPRAEISRCRRPGGSGGRVCGGVAGRVRGRKNVARSG